MPHPKPWPKEHGVQPRGCALPPVARSVESCSEGVHFRQSNRAAERVSTLMPAARRRPALSTSPSRAAKCRAVNPFSVRAPASAFAWNQYSNHVWVMFRCGPHQRRLVLCGSFAFNSASPTISIRTASALPLRAQVMIGGTPVATRMLGLTPDLRSKSTNAALPLVHAETAASCENRSRRSRRRQRESADGLSPGNPDERPKAKQSSRHPSGH